MINTEEALRRNSVDCSDEPVKPKLQAKVSKKMMPPKVPQTTRNLKVNNFMTSSEMNAGQSKVIKFNFKLKVAEKKEK